MNSPDNQLLSRYLDHKDEGAFSQIVATYSGMVLSVARRTTGNQEAAQEAAQNTFIKLAQKAPSLRGRESLGGWLHKTAMFSARSITRTRRREERKRDEFSNSIASDSSSPETIWKNLEPVLDDSLMSLSERDRNALIMRFYRGYSVQEVATEANVTLAAAQKRLGRALEKLRSHLSRRGVALSAPALTSSLGLWMGDATCQAALVTSWAATAAQSISTYPITFTTILITMTKTKLFTGIAIIALLSGGGAFIINLTQQPSPATAGGTSLDEDDSQTPNPDSTSRRTPGSKKLRLQELEKEFGASRVKQAKLIADYYNTPFGNLYDNALPLMDAAEQQWLEAQSEKWGLDPDQTRQLQQLITARKNELIKDLNQVCQGLTDVRTATCVEAILLADKVKRGQLSLSKFEEIHRELSEGNQDLWNKVKQLSWMDGGSGMFIDISLMNLEFLDSVAEIIPSDKRDIFLEEASNQSRELANSLLQGVKYHVPDLSGKQSAQLENFVRSTGIVMIERDDIKEFLTEDQTRAWMAKEEKRSAAPSASFARIKGSDGESTEVEIKPRRETTGGQMPAYFWKNPLTLDEAEAEARKFSQLNGLISTETESSTIIEESE